MGKISKLTIVVPCYNERATIGAVYRAVRDLDLPCEKEIVIVDDASDDGTREFLYEERSRLGPDPGVKFVFHEKNRGKGAALVTALEHATGDYIVAQDADLEYDPGEIARLIECVEKYDAHAVYGSRNTKRKKTYRYAHYYYGVEVLRFLINKLFRVSLTDPETCYKLVRTDLLRGFGIEERGFGIEIEFTANLAARRVRIHEVPISYRPRSFAEGKKIRPKDGIRGLYLIFKYYLRHRKRFRGAKT